MDISTTVAGQDERRADVQKLPAMPTPPPTSPESEELAGPASPSASSEASTSTLNSEDDEKLLDAKVPAGQRISIYVQVFEEMLETVLERESYLFNDEEKDMLARFSAMSYEARYLFVRLFSRKNGWFRLAKLGYHDEIANMKRTVDELCGLSQGSQLQVSEHHADIKDEDEEMKAGPSTIVIPSSPVISESGIVVIASDTEDEVEDRKGKKRARDIDPLSNRSIQEIKQDEQSFGLSRFAISEEILASRADIDELLSLLSLDELKILGKDLRVTSSKATRPLLIEAIKRTASNQSTLKSMFAAGQARQEARSNGRKTRQSPKMDTKSIIARQTEHVISKILSQLGHCVKLESGPIRLFARLHLLYYRSVTYSEKSLTQAVLSRFKIRNYPSYAVKRSFTIFADRQALVDYEEALILERRMEEFLGEAVDPSKGRSTKKFTKEDREKGFRDGLKLFEEVYPRWTSLVAEAQAHDLDRGKLVKDEFGDLQEPPDDRLTYYRKRFLAGWPLTRIVYKGTTILARLHQYDREVEVLRTLLAQSCFRRGKRGEWYDRLALVLMNHTGGDKDENRREALAVCEEGLAHPWTHLIYHNSLQRRIVRLEGALGVPADERRPPVPGLRAAKKRIMKGEKLSEGETGKKSSWRGMDGAEISVEALSLECYNKESWKGFHSENGILTTIFALLFWDVIFAPIDGVFETAYQAGPLDLSTDAFAIVRSELVQERLQAIEAGKAYDMLLEADEREREKKTYCVGLRWAYEREDLLEIVQCLSPEALVTICRVYAEEWSHRTGGVPDLFLWNFEEKRARFVEVKGPGDILSETQKVWIDVLLSTNVEVELCSVKQIFEEDELSLSEDERARLAPLRRRKRGSNEGSVTPQKKDRRASEACASDSDDSETPKKKAKTKKTRVEAVSDAVAQNNARKSSRSISNAPTAAKAAPRRASSGISAKKRKSVASNTVIVLSD